MSHYENTGAPTARSPGPDDERLPEALRTAPDADAALTELRRNLLLYGTAGQAARIEARTS